MVKELNMGIVSQYSATAILSSQVSISIDSCLTDFPVVCSDLIGAKPTDQASLPWEVRHVGGRDELVLAEHTDCTREPSPHHSYPSQLLHYSHHLGLRRPAKLRQWSLSLTHIYHSHTTASISCRCPLRGRVDISAGIRRWCRW